MSRCPQCHAELPNVDAGQKRCPHCDALLPTPSSVSSRTVDSVDALSPGDGSASQQADEGRNEARDAAGGADSAEQPASGSHRPGDTAGDVVQTLDSVERLPAPTGTSDAAGNASDMCRTVDSVDRPAMITSRANPAITEHEIVQTLVSGEPRVEPKGPADFADGITATFDVAAVRPGNADRRSDDGRAAPPHDLPADEAEMARLWGGISGEPPNVTIKTRQPLDVDHSAPTLVIQERAIGHASLDVVRSLDYDLADRLGEGGMGIVYLARQSSLDRPVAVKVLKPHLLEDESQRVKFLSEAVVTGELEHPGIIPIYDLGRNQDGTLFYSMKRVQGDAWSKVIRRKSLAENLEILMKVCDAIAFAHSRDVIHRDLKPDNIMIGEFGEVLVLDWGLAVTVSADPASANVARIKTMGGTPAYMAPEMATGPPGKIGKHSDVYLLGAILYECVTGKLPRRCANVTSCLAAAGRNEIEPTEEKGELVDVARHAMAKEPADRYPSVQALQAAMREYLSHAESIALTTRAAGDLDAARASNDYRDFSRALFGFEESLQLWSANARAQGGIREARLAYATSAYHKGDYDLGLSLLQADTPDHVELRDKLKAAQEERQARVQRLRTARRVVLTLAALVFLAVATGTALVWLAKREADFQRDVARKNEIEARHQKTKANQNEQLAIGQKKIAQQQRQVAVENEQEADRQRQAALRNEQEAIRQREKAEYEAYVALIGLAAAKIDERAFGQAAALLEQCQPGLRNWEWGRLMHLCRPRNVELLDAGHRVECVAFDSTGTRVAAAGLDGIARVWDVRTGELSGQVQLESPGSQALAVAISPANANLLALGSNVEGRVLRICDLVVGEQRILAGHTAEVVSVEFSTDGKHLLSASKDHTAALWDVSTGALVRQFRGHHWWVWDASFSPDENLIVTASEDGTARIWDRETGEQRMSVRGEPMPFTGHRGAVFSAAFSPDGQHVATGGFDRRVLLWKPAELRPFDFEKLLDGQPVPKPPFQTLGGHAAAVCSVAFSHDGRFLLTGSHDNSLIVWSACNQTIDDQPLARGAIWKTLRGHSSLVRGAVYSPTDPNRAASASYDGTVRLWGIREYEEARVLAGTVLRGHADAILTANFSPTGDYVITASRDRTARSWDPRTGDHVRRFQEGHHFLVTRGVFYPDGRRLLTAAGDGSARVWDVTTGAELFAVSGIGHTAAAALSPDGRWIVTARSGAPASGSESEAPSADSEPTVAAAVWDAETGEPVRNLGGHVAPVTAVALTPDSRMIFTGDAKGRGNLWDTATGDLLHTLHWHTGRITEAIFVADGKILLTASDDKTVCPWDLGSGAPRPLENLVLKHAASVHALAVTPDQSLVVTGDQQGVVHVWDRTSAKELWSNRLEADGEVTGVAVSPDGLAGLAVVSTAGGNTKTVCGWEPLPDAAGLSVFLTFDDRDVWSAIFAPDGKSVLTLGGDEAALWDREAQPIQRFGPHRTVSFASYSPDAQKAVTAGWDDTARIWDTNTGSPLLTLSRRGSGDQDGHAGKVNSALFSADGSHVLTASEDGTIKLWDAESGAVVRTLSGHSGGVTFATFSPDGTRVLSTSRDHTVRIWELATGTELRRLEGHALTVWRAAFSDDGARVVTGGEDRLAKTWDATSGAELQTFPGHTAGVTCVAFAPDGRRILTGSADQSVKLWDAANAKEILTLKGHRQAVTSVAFSRDGRNVLSGSRDGTAVIWPSIAWQPTSSEKEERDISRGKSGNSGDPSALALPPKTAF